MYKKEIIMPVEIPGYGTLDIEHLVFDYNGTLADGGIVMSGAADLINRLARTYKIHVITADTFNTVKKELEEVNCSVVVIPGSNQSLAKLDYINKLGKEKCAAIGNGNNDGLMLKEAALGIAIIGDEGAFTSTVLSSDIVCRNIAHAMELFLDTKRLIATMRS